MQMHYYQQQLHKNMCFYNNILRYMMNMILNSYSRIKIPPTQNEILTLNKY